MNNGTSTEVISQFDRIAKLPDCWDHNQQYQDYLLKQIKGSPNIGLDIGCGTGELTKKLALKCKKTIGIDVSGAMIEEARKRSNSSNIEYKHIDIDSFIKNSDNTYDVIISIATFHHLDMEGTLENLKQKLNENGMILILDLYKSTSLFEYFLSIVAALCNPFMYLIKRGTFRNTQEERNAWKDHAQYDSYLSIQEIKRIAQRTLGDVRIKHHLFWRYSLVYKRRIT